MREQYPPRRFDVGAGDEVIVGHLYGSGADPRPTVVLCPGFSGTQDTPAVIGAAEAFADAGLVAATFDYRGFGQSGGKPRQVVSVAGQLDDIRSVLAHIRGIPEVDPDRTALWGTSLGGGHALTIAAEDPRVAAVVAQVPFNGFPKRVEGRSKKDAYALLLAAVRDRVRGWTGRPPLYVKAVGEPDELAVMTGDDANATVAALDSATWRNDVAPRGLLDMMRYRPGRTVHQIDAPLLVCVATADQQTVLDTNRHLADQAPDGRLRSYEGTHFDIYRPGLREQMLRDQTAFLEQSLQTS